MRSTSADKAQAVGELYVESASVQLGQPSVNISTTIKARYRHGLQCAIDPEKRIYDDILRVGTTRPVILYDTGASKTAWLVPQLSIILDLVHFKLASEPEWGPGIQHAKLQSNAGSAASQVLANETVANQLLYRQLDDDKEYRVKHLVKDIYVAMEQCWVLEKFDPPSKKTLRLGRKRLYGWDLVEMLPPRPSLRFRREVAVHSTDNLATPGYPSWLPLSEEVPVLFCDNVGKIITSVVPVCHEGQLHGTNHMVASLRSLARMIRAEMPAKHLHLQGGLVWDLEGSLEDVLAGCDQNCHGTHGRGEPSLNVRINKLKRKLNNECDCFTKGVDLAAINQWAAAEGAVVFGPEQTKFIKLPDTPSWMKKLWKTKRLNTAQLAEVLSESEKAPDIRPVLQRHSYDASPGRVSSTQHQRE